jgi:hypothetical protein
MSISAKHALSREELNYCKRRAAGLANATSYRRAFLREYKGQTYEREDDPKNKDNPPMPLPSKEVSRRAGQLAKQDHIVAYLAELEEGPSERARSVLEEQALWAEDSPAMRAAQTILQEEDKLGIRDAVDQFWAITVKAGADIVVPLPTHCHACGVQLEVTVKAEEMFGVKPDDNA